MRKDVPDMRAILLKSSEQSHTFYVCCKYKTRKVQSETIWKAALLSEYLLLLATDCHQELLKMIKQTSSLERGGIHKYFFEQIKD